MLLFYNSLRSEDEEQYQKDKCDRVLPLSGYLPNSKVFNKAEQKRSDNSTINIADTAGEEAQSVTLIK